MFPLVIAIAMTLAQPEPEGAIYYDGGAPCEPAGGRWSIQSCWNCFQSLLGDCETRYPSRDPANAERRAACMAGARDFFDNCTERVLGAPRSDDREAHSLPEALDLYMSGDERYDAGWLYQWISDFIAPPK